ncbi:MAG: hypothetical protein ACC652_10195 [Acidimicrobiales bacterium]
MTQQSYASRLLVRVVHTGGMHNLAAFAALALIVGACSSSGTSSTPESQPSTSTTIIQESTVSIAETTSSTSTTPSSQPPTTQPPTETTAQSPETFEYAVVAEEQSRRLSIIDFPRTECFNGTEPCELTPVLTIDLPARPHNLMSAGSMVYATHPSTGSISQINIATGETRTVALGTEPHDIKYASSSDTLFVADEAGSALFTIDPATLQVIATLDLPASPHDLAVDGNVIWITLDGRSVLARVEGTNVELLATGGSPHDLIVDRSGQIWFSNRNSNLLNILDPTEGTVVEAPAGVTEPHHFAIRPDGVIWVSDNGGGVVVGFDGGTPVTVEVGPVPHHIGFVGDILVVAVSGAGEAVFVNDDRVVARSPLTQGLHGLAIVQLAEPLTVPG